MLTEGEENRAHRIRAAAEVHEWLTGLSAAERGEILTQAYQAKQTGEEWPRASLSPAPAPASAAPTPGASLDGRTQLQVVSTQIPQAMKNKLRWSVDRYATLEALLSAGELLTLDVTNGKSIWRTATGESIRSDTVLRLLGAGLLA